MLMNGMQETQAKEVELANLRHEVMALLVEYLYTNSVAMSEEMAIELIVAANQMQLSR
jgi:hypothetical protein